MDENDLQIQTDNMLLRDLCAAGHAQLLFAYTNAEGRAVKMHEQEQPEGGDDGRMMRGNAVADALLHVQRLLRLGWWATTANRRLEGRISGRPFKKGPDPFTSIRVQSLARTLLFASKQKHGSSGTREEGLEEGKVGVVDGVHKAAETQEREQRSKESHQEIGRNTFSIEFPNHERAQWGLPLPLGVASAVAEELAGPVINCAEENSGAGEDAPQPNALMMERINSCRTSELRNERFRFVCGLLSACLENKRRRWESESRQNRQRAALLEDTLQKMRNTGERGGRGAGVSASIAQNFLIGRLDEWICALDEKDPLSAGPSHKGKNGKVSGGICEDMTRALCGGLKGEGGCMGDGWALSDEIQFLSGEAPRFGTWALSGSFKFPVDNLKERAAVKVRTEVAEGIESLRDTLQSVQTCADERKQIVDASLSTLGTEMREVQQQVQEASRFAREAADNLSDRLSFFLSRLENCERDGGAMAVLAQTLQGGLQGVEKKMKNLGERLRAMEHKVSTEVVIVLQSLSDTVQSMQTHADERKKTVDASLSTLDTEICDLRRRVQEASRCAREAADNLSHHLNAFQSRLENCQRDGAALATLVQTLQGGLQGVMKTTESLEEKLRSVEHKVRTEIRILSDTVQSVQARADERKKVVDACLSVLGTEVRKVRRPAQEDNTRSAEAAKSLSGRLEAFLSRLENCEKGKGALGDRLEAFLSRLKNCEKGKGALGDRLEAFLSRLENCEKDKGH
uniref:Uncharacterized protein n=1 Tax=Chromera velia CCMP2878 TaxID=1169474 RepID=A0A0G4FNA2_9ALVE|eukprot:Cvel_17899.t1-p1 / transcript=Cvel_17899.t1 / gene=Cvel_17899 / organism=Chromera_velia_CCMP2878 / gene_product=Myosin-11, putative / transcript_product=Myosin-11, putative / location=Cvel_scaffold1453:14871-21586(-) / protein_length=741 / sequence_SO=supercontig / SO=protein_coding / is_pseudo=false